MTEHSAGIFVTGTDTGVGKTVVSAWVARHWQADYWKPVQSGLNVGNGETTDSEQVRQLTDVHCHPERWRLSQPLSPHRAAELDGVCIELDDFAVPSAQRLVVEGAGGLLVPLNDRALMIDLAIRLHFPVLLVARGTLGTINHTLLSIEALRARMIPILGIVVSGAAMQAGQPAVEVEANMRAIEHHGNVRVLGVLPRFDKITPDALAAYPMPQALRQALDSEE